MKLHLSNLLLLFILNIKLLQAAENANGQEQLELQNFKLYSASDDIVYSDLNNLTFSDKQSSASGGALSVSGKNLFIHNVDDGLDTPEVADVLFSNNSCSVTCSSSYFGVKNSWGGAIMNNSKTVDISSNGAVIFSQNSSSAFINSYTSHCTSRGGAIGSTGSLYINDNKDVIFNNNVAYRAMVSCAQGGAIDSIGLVSINNNRNVVFELNHTHTTSPNESTGSLWSRGGAIYSTDTLNVEGNTNVEFFGNYASSTAYRNGYSPSAGGVIYSTGVVNINNNTNEVVFSENYTIANYESIGGAIYSAGTLNINNNNHVKFSKNFVHSTSNGYGRGGAIYSSYADISITGNNSVVFEKNYEIDASSYTLRGIYITGAVSLNLAAKSNGHITFYDSVYKDASSATVSLNADFEDADGVLQKATGDIIFSGKYTEEHLKEVKGGVAGTSTEIEKSRTSSLLNRINLYGGTLRVEDKAVLKTYAINVVAEGNATMKVLDAEVNASTYDVTINSTGQLTLGGTDGSAKLTAKNININQGATLSAERTEVPEATPAITLAAEETVSIFNEKLGGVASGNLNLAAGSAYKADGAHLSVINGTLTLGATADEKINLGLTVGAEYAEDSKVLLFTDIGTVKFVLDNITTTSTGALKTFNAIDYFCGEWINENTELVYEAGTLYLVGVNRVIPEPTTATLSLLALAGLVARRRRK